jgi:imidazolonepropionase
MLIRQLSGIFTGRGFVERDGRRPRDEDCGFVAGPIDLSIDDATGTVAQLGADLRAPGASIDGSGSIAISGFIDPHTHAIFAGHRAHEYFMRWAGKSYLQITQAGGGIYSTVAATRQATEDQLSEALRLRLRGMLRGGATTVEVKSGYANSAAGELRLLHVIKSLRDQEDLPEIRASFLGLHALPPGRKEDAYVDEMISLLPQVANERLADHVDTFPEKGFFTLESALRFSEAARGVGLPAKVHADELCDLGSSEAFARSGALSIDHLQHISDRAVQLLATSNTVATMLPATSFFVGLPYANARRLIDAGARVAVATDFNPGTAPAWDLQLTHLLAASQMKMTAAEILCATTFNSAAALGLEKTHGALLPGRVANVLLFDGSDTWDQIVLQRRRPTKVIVRGRVMA